MSGGSGKVRPISAGSRTTATEQANLRAVAEVLPAWNRHDIEGVLAFYDPEIVWTNVAMEERYRGPEEVGGFLRSLFTAFPDLRFDVTWRIARGDEVAEQWVMSGTHAGRFSGIPGTGRQFELLGMSRLRMRESRFLADDFYFDSAGFMRQTGLLPPLSVVRTPAAGLVLGAAARPRRSAAVAAAALSGVYLARRVARLRR